MSPCLSRISVLEQVPLFEGGEARRTLEDLVRLGRGLEESGYHRLWLAEHHSTGSFRCCSVSEEERDRVDRLRERSLALSGRAVRRLSMLM